MCHRLLQIPMVGRISSGKQAFQRRALVKRTKYNVETGLSHVRSGSLALWSTSPLENLCQLHKSEESL
jgi:hypothetical protein